MQDEKSAQHTGDDSLSAQSKKFAGSTDDKSSSLPELDDSFFETADALKPAPKQQMTIRLDAEVLEFFKREGRGYQSRINAVLKAYVQVQKSKGV